MRGGGGWHWEVNFVLAEVQQQHFWLGKTTLLNRDSTRKDVKLDLIKNIYEWLSLYLVSLILEAGQAKYLSLVSHCLVSKKV